MFTLSEILGELDRQLAESHTEYCVRIPSFDGRAARVSTAADRRRAVGVYVTESGIVCGSRTFGFRDGLSESVRPVAAMVRKGLGCAA